MSQSELLKKGVSLFVSAPEDTIIAKLHWSKLSGGSTKQRLDALRVYEMQAEVIDKNYLSQWVEKMNLHSDWEAMLTLNS
jgi:hypothetical protein